MSFAMNQEDIPILERDDYDDLLLSSSEYSRSSSVPLCAEVPPRVGTISGATSSKRPWAFSNATSLSLKTDIPPMKKRSTSPPPPRAPPSSPLPHAEEHLKRFDPVSISRAMASLARRRHSTATSITIPSMTLDDSSVDGTFVSSMDNGDCWSPKSFEREGREHGRPDSITLALEEPENQMSILCGRPGHRSTTSSIIVQKSPKIPSRLGTAHSQTYSVEALDRSHIFEMSEYTPHPVHSMRRIASLEHPQIASISHQLSHSQSLPKLSLFPLNNQGHQRRPSPPPVRSIFEDDSSDDGDDIMEVEEILYSRSTRSPLKMAKRWGLSGSRHRLKQRFKNMFRRMPGCPYLKKQRRTSAAH